MLWRDLEFNDKQPLRAPTLPHDCTGWSETDQCRWDAAGPCNGGTSRDYVIATNTALAAATATGITIVASSGDSGAHGRTVRT